MPKVQLVGGTNNGRVVHVLIGSQVEVAKQGEWPRRTVEEIRASRETYGRPRFTQPSRGLERWYLIEPI